MKQSRRNRQSNGDNITNENTANTNFDNIIIPQRYIPFDIGMRIDSTTILKFENYFKDNNYKICEKSGLLKSISSDVIFKIEISTALRLYIFSYGIGVFMLEDNLYQMKEKFAVEYCEYRKKAHKEILEFAHESISIQIQEIIRNLRTLVSDKKKNIRPSANEEWESHGLSYVMTVSYIIKKDKERKNYEEFTEIEKKDLQIMLQPSIAHKEDTLTMAEYLEPEHEFDPYNFQVEKIAAPINWIKSEDCAIYISWAAVVIYLQDLLGKYMELIEYLEVDLQAMWLYTYCQYINLKSWAKRKKLTSVELKKLKFNFQRKYNEFISDNDSSIPIYIFNIRNELINTSGIDHEKNNYMEYIDFCIDETESYEAEQQRKYSVMNEVLLFIIAFVQIAPMMYAALTGQYKDLQLWPVIVMVIVVIVAIIFIVKKD